MSLVADSIFPNTRRAYRSDLAQFEAWGGVIPTAPLVVASYLADHAGTLSVATLVRRVATISKAHAAKGLPNPCGSEIVRATLRGIKRRHGTAQHEAKPLLKEDLFLVLDAMGNGVKDIRDRALLLLGFAGGFRRSELVSLDTADIVEVRQGLIIILRRSKTDQEGDGRKIGIPYGRTRYCPVGAVAGWRAGITDGAIFRPIDRHAHVHPERGCLTRDQRPCRGGRHQSNWVLRPQPAGWFRHECRPGGGTDRENTIADRPRLRRYAGPIYPCDGELFTDNAVGALL